MAVKTTIQVMRNVLSNWGSFVLGAAIGFLMMPFLVHRLGDTQYGVWVLIMNFTGYLGLFDLGVSGSVVKYVAEFKAKRDQQSLNQVCSAAYYIYLAAGLLAFCVSLILAFYFVHLFKIPTETLSDARVVTIIVGLQIGLTLPFSFFTGFMRGMQRYDLVALVSVVILLVRSISIVFFVLYGYGLITLALIHLASTILGGCIRVFYVYKSNPDLKLAVSFVNRKKLRLVSGYSILIFLYYVASRMIFATHSFVIAYFLAASVVTLYAIPQRLVEDMRVVIMATGVLQPTVSHLDAEGKNHAVQRLLISGTKYTLMIVLPIAVSYIVVGYEFVSLWMGNYYASASYVTLVILTIAMVAHISQFTATQILQGIAKHKSVTYIAIGEGIVNFGLSLLLVKEHGMVGVALGTMIPMLVTNLLIIPVYACRTVTLSIFQFLKESFVRPFFSAFSFGIILYGISRLTGLLTWSKLIPALVSGLICYGIIAWFVCLTREERFARWKELVAVLRPALALAGIGSLFARSRLEK
jgi:O-antigen/teichoic acid export membrane protein